MKYLKRLAARHAFQNLLESGANKYIVMRDLILETEAGDLELNSGDEIEVGATNTGDMAVDAGLGSAAVVVISDAEIANRIADAIASADELDDIRFVDHNAVDAALDSEDLDDTVNALADEEGTDVEMAEIEPAEESVESKLAKFESNRMNPAKTVVCESILVADEAKPVTMNRVKVQKVVTENFNDYNTFCEAVSARKASIAPGAVEIVLSESNKYIGSWNKEENAGKLFVENEFEDVEAMSSFSDEAEPVMQDIDFEGAEEVVEGCIKEYEESSMTGADYAKLMESLEAAGVKEDKMKVIAESYKMPAMKSCVRVFDTKLGVFTRAFKESVDCNNFIAEANMENRLTKRYFA